ncbi:MAG: 6,7-dimethyl-8-ribityllumazine synthase [Dehalococcoidia bacterium]
MKFGIVVSRFNETITTRLLNGALEGLKEHGVEEDDVDVAWTPGALEIPLVAKRMADSGKYSAVICLGAVIRGETAHFDYVSSGVTQGVVEANLETEVPILFGVLTTYDLTQAKERSGGRLGNKGFDAAVNAIEMANLLKKLPGS